ncbi:response regulator transcription factor [Cytophagales bacterium LB-30]|uniref:Response regulator transcription factor n=1 Tax=Shiella aurantiaca TaxID=3058365 RepID=A0ABT8F3D7_9BACT|nr:response regulator transcription factor [Shiella aurantiaca]MDN4164970.1 response regulator transcription factor [Shiella aurantiaca]
MKDGKILIIEDELIVAHHIRKTLEAEGYSVGPIANSYESTLAAIAQSVPNLILCDINIKGELNGIEVVKDIQKKHDVSVIYVTAFSDEKTVRAAVGTNPSGFLLKPFTDRQLLIAVELALAPATPEKAGNGKTQDLLTDREMEILSLLAKGKNSEEIGQLLNISLHTVKTHRKNMLSRLKMKKATELIAWATKNGHL